MESETIEESAPQEPLADGPKKGISKKRKSKKIFQRIDSEEEFDSELAEFVDNSATKKRRVRSKRGYVDKKL